jgi:hypothetical protein
MEDFLQQAIAGGIESKKPHRMDYMRVEVEMAPLDVVELAKVGVNGKKHKTHPLVAQYHAYTKEGFKLDCPGDDIDDFIDNFDWDEQDVELPPYETELARLSRIASTLAGDSSQQGLDDNEMVNTSLYAALSLISDVGVELAISYKQHVRNDAIFLVKKVPCYDLFMLIKPTKSSSHLFCSFMMPKRGGNSVLQQRPFREMVDYDTYWATDFVSFDTGRINNLVTAPYVLNAYDQYMRVTYPDSLSLMKSLNLCILAHLEDKRETTDSMTVMRYISMKLFTISEVDSGMAKLVTKFPKTLRSRLSAWVVRKCAAFMTSGAISPERCPRDDDPSEGKERDTMKWRLRHPYFGTLLKDHQELIDVYYYGYFRDKYGLTEKNQDPNLAIKILEQEIELEHANNQNFGSETVYDLGGFSSGHEWSNEHVLAAADITKTYFKRTTGPGWQALLSSDIMTNLNNASFEQLATFKASSMFEPGSASKPNEKLLIRITQIVDRLKGTYFLSIPDLVELLQATSALNVSLFSKNQKTGIREISILDVVSRLCQSIIETIARCICRRLHIETLENPRNKEALQVQHNYKVSRAFDKEFTLCSSYDAKRWNQYHHVTKFMMFLNRILPKEYHGLTTTILSAWYTKNIQLPKGLVSLLEDHPGLEVTDPTLQRMINVHAGLESVTWMKSHSDYITTETGMLQGILHYVSSAFHASCLLLRDAMFKLSLESLRKERGGSEPVEVITMDQVSSDDSGRMSSCHSDDLFLRGLIIADHLAYRFFMPFFGIHESEKSALCCFKVYEFNSTWMVGGTIVNPIIKFIIASMVVTEEESLFGRQEVLYGGAQNCLENGASFEVVHIVQVHQLGFFYKVLGASSNRGFSAYADALALNPDPGLGFFLKDSRFCTGLFGLKYALWMASQKSDALSGRLAAMLQTGDYSTSTSGTFTNVISIRWGNLARYERLKEKMEACLPADWESKIDADPFLLYSFPRGALQNKLKLMAKFTNPSVAKSLAGLPSLCRVIASSVYIISHRACSTTKRWAGIHDTGFRTSLLANISLRQVEGVLTEEQEKFLFPFLKSYRATRKQLEDIRACTVHRADPDRKRNRAQFSIFSTTELPPISLEESCKGKWFGCTIKVSKQQKDDCWAKYQALFPWLKETHDATKEELQMTTIQLRNFIGRIEDKERNMKLITMPFRGGFNHSVVTILMKNYSMSEELRTEGNMASLEVSNDTPATLHKVAMLVLYPHVSYDSLVKSVVEEIKGAEDPWVDVRDRVNRGATNLSIVKKWLHAQETGDVKDFYRLLEFMKAGKRGVLGYWTTKQTFDPRSRTYGGLGIWLGYIGNANVTFHVRDKTVVQIETDSSDKLYECRLSLEEFLDSEGFSVSDKPITRYSGLYVSLGNKVVHGATDGLTVDENKYLNCMLTTNTLRKCTLEITKARPGAPAAIRIKKGNATCMSLTLYSFFLRPSLAAHLRSPNMTTWYRMGSLDRKAAHTWLMKYMNDRTDDSTRENIAEMIRGSLSRNGFELTGSSATISPQDIIPPSSITLDIPEIDLDAIAKDFSLFCGGLPIGDLGLFDSPTYDSAAPTTTHLWDFLPTMRWLDDLFCYWRSQLPRRDLDGLFNGEGVTRLSEPLADILNFFLDMNIRIVEASKVLP